MPTATTFPTTAVALLKAVADLPGLSSSLLLQAIVRGRKFGSLTDPYESSVHWGALAHVDTPEIQAELDRLCRQGILKRVAGYSSRVVFTQEGLEKFFAFQDQATELVERAKVYSKTFEQVRTELVEASARRLYESYVGREILVREAIVYAEDCNSDLMYFSPPLLARVRSEADQSGYGPELERWMSDDHLDPLWPVEVLDDGGQLKPGEKVYEVFGLGWERGVGYQKTTSAWSLAPEIPRKQVRCRLNGAQTGLFTDGKVYEAYKEPGKEYCNLWTVADDFGYERVILLDKPCPHLNRYWRDEHWPYNRQKPVGVFETVPT